MLVKYITLEEDKSIEISYYDSSNIIKSYYNFTNESLRIVFGSGKVYMYDHVSETEYMNFKMSNSQGKFFNANFRTKNYSQVGVESPEQITIELENISNNERSNFFELAKLKMRDFVTLNEFDKAKAEDIINTLRYLL